MNRDTINHRPNAWQNLLRVLIKSSIAFAAMRTSVPGRLVVLSGHCAGSALIGITFMKHDESEPMQPDVIEYASARTPRRPSDWLRLGPFFAVVCSAFAWLKSCQYHTHGHLPDEQISTLILVGLSLPCLAVTLFRSRRYRSDGRTKVVVMVLLSLAAVILDALALWNLHTATGYRLF